MNTSRTRFGLALFFAACSTSGCGGGLSGPDSNTSAGLGTLLVNVTGAGDEGVVFLEKLARPTRNGRARFYNVQPGRYLVTASLPQKFSDSRSVDIVADKTLSITLSPRNTFATPTPIPLTRTALVQ